MPQDKCRILCIDDHEDTSEMLQLLLSHENYEVDVAVTVQDALAQAAAGSYDLYVMDRHLPDGSGLELCETLTKTTPGVPCIFYSGDAYAIHRSEAIAAGADDYVVKPDIDKLIDTVSQMLSEKHCTAATATATS